MKKIEEMKLSELMELKTASDMISEDYAKELITYAEVNKDPYMQFLSKEDKIKYDKRIKTQKLSNKIKQRIETIISEYYE